MGADRVGGRDLWCVCQPANGPAQCGPKALWVAGCSLAWQPPPFGSRSIISVSGVGRPHQSRCGRPPGEPLGMGRIASRTTDLAAPVPRDAGSRGNRKPIVRCSIVLVLVPGAGSNCCSPKHFGAKLPCPSPLVACPTGRRAGLVSLAICRLSTVFCWPGGNSSSFPQRRQRLVRILAVGAMGASLVGYGMGWIGWEVTSLVSARPKVPRAHAVDAPVGGLYWILTVCWSLGMPFPLPGQVVDFFCFVERFGGGLGLGWLVSPGPAANRIGSAGTYALLSCGLWVISAACSGILAGAWATIPPSRSVGAV